MGLNSNHRTWAKPPIKRERNDRDWRLFHELQHVKSKKRRAEILRKLENVK